MKHSLIILAAGLALVAASAGSSVPIVSQESRVAAAPEAARAPWLLAQDRSMPSCKLDNRDVPTGTTYCRQKRLWVCERGSWVDSGKAC